MIAIAETPLVSTDAAPERMNSRLPKVRSEYTATRNQALLAAFTNMRDSR